MGRCIISLLLHSTKMTNSTIGVNSSIGVVNSMTIKDVVYTIEAYHGSIRKVFVSTKGYNILVSLGRLVFVFYCYVFLEVVKIGYRMC